MLVNGVVMLFKLPRKAAPMWKLVGVNKFGKCWMVRLAITIKNLKLSSKPFAPTIGVEGKIGLIATHSLLGKRRASQGGNEPEA